MEKHLPQNIEAEQCVLGSILIDPEAIVEVSEFLKPCHFYRDAHKIIYETILRLYERHEAADLITVCDELERVGKLSQVGNIAGVNALTVHVPTSGNVEEYARIVKRTWVYRQLIGVAGRAAARAYEQEEDALALTEAEVFQISQDVDVRQVSDHVAALDRYMTSLMDLHDANSKGVLPGVPTGLKPLDKLLGGLRAKKMYILAARPGDGKTALALNIADSAVRSGCSVLFFSLEMDEEELMQRWLSMESRVDSTHLRDAHFGEEADRNDKTEWERVMDAHSRLAGLPGKLHLDDTSNNTDTAMRSKAKRIQSQHGLDLIIVDYLQFARSGSGKKQDRRLEVEEVSRNLKVLARELNVPILVLAQLNRDVESRPDRKPKLFDLREAGGIENDADVAMFIYKRPDVPEDATEFPVELLIEKHRNGQKGSVQLYFVGAQTRFYLAERKA